MAPRVSIIVPVYGAELTLARCLEGLLAQTFSDFELLLVDDGSKDGSGRLCDEYAAKDKRVRVFHKENGGVSSARQFGLEHAKGDYIIHADPDDWVEPGMLEALYQKAVETGADMVICDFYEDTLSGRRYIKQQPSSLQHEVVLRELFQQLHGSCWNKLVRRACYNKYGVRFPEGVNFCEDQYVNAALLVHPLRVAYLPQAFYHYVKVMDNASQSRSYSERSYKQDLHIRDIFVDLLRDTPIVDMVRRSQTEAIVSRAFFFGSSFYTNREFRRRFASYRKLYWQSHDALPFRLMICLSCLGLYHPTINLLNWALRRKAKRR